MTRNSRSTSAPSPAFTWVLQPMLGRSGFSIREAHYNDAGTFADYLCERMIGASR